MNYYTTIEIDNCIKNIIIKPALYINTPIWEITMDDKKYILRKGDNGWEQGIDQELSTELLNKIGTAIDYLWIKDAG